MNIELIDLTHYDVYQGILTFFILILGMVICSSFATKISDIKIIISLYLWHTLFSVYYWYYTLKNGGDAVLYYKKTFYLLPDFSPGTRFTESITQVITNIFDSNYLNTTLIFNYFGALGLTFLYLSLKPHLKKSNSLWMLVLFIPSMSFWSAGLGKDSIAFLATCLFLYAVSKHHTHRLSILTAFLVMFMVRPHIAFIMLASFIVFFIAQSKTHIIIKVLILPVIIGGAVIALQFVQQYVGLAEVSLDSLDSYVEKRQGYNLEGGSSLDISSMSYPMQMFTYIFRPLPFEAHSIVALVTSIENTILLLLFIYIFFKSKFNFKPFINDKNLWLFIYVFLTCTILAITTANLGIATRQKWMFMPVLIYLLIYAFYDYKTKNNKVYS